MLDDSVKVQVESIGRGSVGYQPDTNPMIRRRWNKPGIVKTVPLGEIREVITSPGGEILFRDHLLIRDIEIRKELDLPVEEEAIVGEKELGDLLSGNPAKLKSRLPELGAENQKRLAHKAAEMKLDNMSKLQFIKEITGIDVYRLMEEKESKK